MKTIFFARKLRPAVARSFNIRHRAVLAVAFILALVVAPTLIPQHGLLTSSRAEAATSPTGAASTDEQTRARAVEAFGKLPLYFVQNRGQLDKRVGYYVQGSDKTIYFTNQGLTFLLNGKPEAQNDAALQAGRMPALPGSGANPQSAIRTPQSQRWALKLDFVGQCHQGRHRLLVVSHIQEMDQRVRTPDCQSRRDRLSIEEGVVALLSLRRSDLRT